MRKFTKESTTYFCTKTEDVCADGNIQTRHSESNEKLRKTTALESHFEEHAKEGWERIWIFLACRATLLNTYPPKLIATILKALRATPKKTIS